VIRARCNPLRLIGGSEDVKRRLFNSPTSTLVNQAQELASKGQLVEAEIIFAKAVEPGTDARALEAFGNFLAALGRLSQARETYERLIALSAKSGENGKQLDMLALDGSSFGVSS